MKTLKAIFSNLLHWNWISSIRSRLSCTVTAIKPEMASTILYLFHFPCKVVRFCCLGRNGSVHFTYGHALHARRPSSELLLYSQAATSKSTITNSWCCKCAVHTSAYTKLTGWIDPNNNTTRSLAAPDIILCDNGIACTSNVWNKNDATTDIVCLRRRTVSLSLACDRQKPRICH